MPMRIRLCRRAALVVVLALMTCLETAPAQSEKVKESLQELHDDYLGSGRIVSRREGEQAIDRLNAWRLKPEALEGEPKAQTLGVRVLAALAIGDAAAARERFTPLLDEFPDRRATQEIGYLVACAGGDAYAGEAVLKALSKLVESNERREVSRKRRWIRGVGEQAPDVEIRTEDTTSFDARRRGDNVLLIDFWNLRSKPAEAHQNALKALHQEYEKERYLDFVGVNADAEEHLNEARIYAKSNGYEWKQRYEGVARDAPITHQAFDAGSPPWAVIVDSYGYVRTIGDASEPALQYALRAALAEARGDLEPVRPRTRDGKTPERPGDSIAAAPDGKPSDQAGAEELPSDPAAAQKLTQARTFLRARSMKKAKQLLEQIVREHPGTLEAAKAQELLEITTFP